MSQSPDKFVALDPNDSYLKNFDALGAMIGRGRSFSGRERNCVFLNTGDARFSDVSAATGLDFIDDARAIAVVDWDQDGDLDLWIGNRNAPRVRLVRNDMKTSNHFLAVRLDGRTCNRDAIGARLELHLTGDTPRKIVKSTRAGDGFLSQSSKWVHFGIGPSESIGQLVVRWPGREDSESFTALQVDRRYHIVQGSGEAKMQYVPARDLVLKASGPNVPQATDHARMFLTRRTPLPKLSYLNSEGQMQLLEFSPGRATLICLWASWCTPCIGELSELVAREQELRNAGLDVVALSADEVTSSPLGNVTDPQEVLSRIKWPHASARATRQAVRDLTLVQHQVVYRERPLPLPTSFLVDPQNKVAAIYKGPLPVERLLNDVRMLTAPRDQIGKMAFPFPGKAATRLFSRDVLAVASSYLEGGYFDDAKQELTNYIDDDSNKVVTDEEPEPKRSSRKLAEAFVMLATIEKQQGRLGEAISAFRQAVKLAPNLPMPRVSLALALWASDDRHAARQQLDHILRTGSEDARILNLLGQTYNEFGESDRAIELYRRALELQPTDFAIRTNLAVALQSSGNAHEAVSHYRTVLKQRPTALDAANNLAWILATHQDQSVRNPAEAVRLARHVAQATGQGQPSVLDTLATALAAAGNFDEAVSTAEQALKMARAQKQTSLTKKIYGRLQLYRQLKPYRQLSTESPAAS